MKTAAYDYDLPEEAIAQSPPAERTAARLMVVHREQNLVEHRQIADLPRYLRAGDVVVVNDTRVIPARLRGRRVDTGGQVELLLVREVPEPVGADVAGAMPNRPTASCAVRATRVLWQALYKASGRARPGLCLTFAEGALNACVVAVGKDCVTVALEAERPLAELLDEIGATPLPPYIRREPGQPAARLDRERYQTVFARAPGAVAAPTAGLHFTEALLAELAERGVKTAAITLHVGPGTFRPVQVENAEDHRMDAEWYEVGDQVVADINDARDRGGRVVAVGSTTVRTLETVVAKRGFPVAGRGDSSLFIRPPYRFKIVDAMLTNFHLPRSTLLMMVSAFCGFRGKSEEIYSDAEGRQRLLALYAEAVRRQYRFFSYGDAMLLL
jgi:S-adenosylmethionine:tRNA ribosyltransferase-isomerase